MASKPRKLYANAQTKIVHANSKGDSCRQSELLSTNVKKFVTLEEAIAAGYKKCGRCKWPSEAAK